MTLSLLLWCSLSWAGAPTTPAPASAPTTPPSTEVAAAPAPASTPDPVTSPGAAQVALAASLLAVLLALGAGVHSVLLVGRIRRLEDAARSSARNARNTSRGSADSNADWEDPGVSLGSSRGTGTRGEGRNRAAPLAPPADPQLEGDQETNGRAPPTRERTVLNEPATPPARPDPRGVERARPGLPESVPASPTEPLRANPVVKAAEGGESPGADRWLRTLSAGRHGGIASAIGGVYLDSAEMAQMFRMSANREEFVRVAQTALKTRLERFASMQRAPASNFRHDWVEPDLLPILDGLSNLYARALTEQRNGNAAAGAVAARLHEVLYLQLGPVCQDAGWFSIQTIIPFETNFDPIRHTAIGSAEAAGASDRVVDIRQAGRLDAVSGTVIAPAHVVVGR